MKDKSFCQSGSVVLVTLPKEVRVYFSTVNNTCEMPNPRIWNQLKRIGTAITLLSEVSYACGAFFNTLQV